MHKGYLKKWAISGSHSRPAKRRYFVLLDSGLLKYSESETSATKGEITLTHDSVLRSVGDDSKSASGSFQFDLVTPSMGAHRSLRAVAASADERRHWLEALGATMERLRSKN